MCYYSDFDSIFDFGPEPLKCTLSLSLFKMFLYEWFD